MDSPLADRQCVPCRGGVPPMPRGDAQTMLSQLRGDWQISPDGHLQRTFDFDDFAGAMAFANRVAEIAEREGHHPDLHIAWGKCTLEIWTHKIGGLTQSDFYLAAKVDRLP